MKTSISTTGWRRPTRIASRGLFVLLLLLPVPALGRGKEAPPDAGLLEFLGTYETAGGEAIDPGELADLPAPEKRQTTKPGAGGAPSTPKKRKKDETHG